MKFDSMRAWNEAMALLRANREALVALAGMFLFLPSFAAMLLAPPPDAKGITQFPQLAALYQGYMRENWPVLVTASLVVSIGTLAILALLADRSRPTVADCVKAALKTLLPLVAAQILIGMALILPAAILTGLAAATKLAALVTLVLLGVIGVIAFVAVRVMLLTPVMIAEKRYNPVDALARSWVLTKGQFWRLLAFFVLLMVAVTIVTGLIDAGVGMLVTLIGGDKAGEIASGLISSLTGTASNLVYLAALAASYRQLSGRPAETAQTFD